MKDNGLLKYYRQKHHEACGRLSLSNYPFRIQLEYAECYGTVRVMYDGDKKYYFKLVSKEETDAEVLLSQIYAKAGFKTAIYTPLDATGVICQNIESEKCRSARSFLERKFQEDNAPQVPKLETARISGSSVPRFYTYFENYSKFFTKKGAEEYLKMRLFDVATENTDRHLGNFYIEENASGKAGGIELIDYGASGDRNRGPKFYSLLSGKTREFGEEVIQEFKTNEEVNNFVCPHKVAEEIGNIDPVQIASDIQKTIDYKVDSDFVNRISCKMEQAAEALIK